MIVLGKENCDWNFGNNPPVWVEDGSGFNVVSVLSVFVGKVQGRS